MVGQEEIDVGNNIYGNPIKKIKYDIKQIKVQSTMLFLILVLCLDLKPIPV